MATLTPQERLELFNERADELNAYSFVKSLIENPDVIKLRFDGTNIELETNFPSRESTSAFVHVLRQFMQDNDAISFGNLAKEYNALPIGENLKEKFSSIRVNLNKFLDSEADDFSVADQGPEGGPAVPMSLNRRYILDTFVYGGLSHNNPSKRAIIAAWQAHPLTFAIMTHVFSTTLAIMLQYIIAARRLNERVLAQLAE